MAATRAAPAPDETRAETLWACVCRLREAHGVVLGDGETLTVLLAGADHREGRSADETLGLFRPFCERAAREQLCSRLRLALVGPNLARALHRSSHERALRVGDAAGRALQCQVRYYVGSVNAWWADAEAFWPPDLAVCFNAGVWGYDEWRPALRLLLSRPRAPPPLLVTSYNELEAGDDEDVLAALAPAARWFWRPEKNPSGSAAPRATRNAIGRVLHENDFWMCLGGVEPPAEA